MFRSIAKPLNQQQGLYTPLWDPSRPWESISMDHLMGYTTKKHQHDMNLLLFDIFSNMSILIPCKNTMKTQNIAHLFF